MPKIGNFGKFLNIVTRQVNFKRTKNVGKCQISKSEMRHFELFSNTVHENIEKSKKGSR